MFAVTRLRVPEAEVASFSAAVAVLLAALGARPGFRDGEVGRAADDPTLWALVTRWDGVGAYRRGLSAAEVKIAGAPVWVYAVDEPGVYLPGSDGPSADGRAADGPFSDGRRTAAPSEVP